MVSTYGLTETGSGVVYDGVALDGVEVDISPGPGLIRAARPDAAARLPGRHRPPRRRRLAHDRRRRNASTRPVVSSSTAGVDELIITGGENVWPDAVEPILRRHPGVADVAVAGRPDPDWGQRVVAWVIPQTPSQPPGLDALRRLVADELAGFAAPRELVLVDELPKTSIGKIRRKELP